MTDTDEKPVLIILEGEQTGQRWAIDGDEFVIGRGASCSLVLPERQVSREHIRIYTEDDTYFLQDLNSKNGTWVNGEQVKGGIVNLRDGDEISIALAVRMTYDASEATAPLMMDQGDWASITYYNEGLQIHPMHLHQFPQLVYAKDGVPLDVPYWVDTLNVAPGERYTVLFRADDPGTWVWHCHILTHVEREEGMFGMVTAIVVNENPDFDPSEQPVQPHNWRKTAGPTIDPDAGPIDPDAATEDTHQA